jgi:hypothetical protein
MSEEAASVDMKLVEAIYTQAVARAIGDMKEGVSFDAILERSIEAAKLMNKAYRARQNQGMENWLRTLPTMK